MDPKELYQKQYQRKPSRLKAKMSFKGILGRWNVFGGEVVKKMLENETGKRILDVGCGDGELLFRIKDSFNKLYGLDIAKNRILRAQKRTKEEGLEKKLIFRCIDVEKGLPLKDNFFDVVICIALLEHIFDPFFLVEEMGRILKPGGKLIVLVPNIAYLKHRLGLLLGKLPKTSGMEIGWDGGHLHYFTKKSLVDLLKKYNFKIIKVSGSGILAPLRNWWPSFLTGDLIIKAKHEKGSNNKQG